MHHLVRTAANTRGTDRLVGQRSGCWGITSGTAATPAGPGYRPHSTATPRCESTGVPDSSQLRPAFSRATVMPGRFGLYIAGQRHAKTPPADVHSHRSGR